MEIRWLVSVSASCFHAVGEMLRRRRLVDTALSEQLTQPVDQLHSYCQAWGVDAVVLVDHLTAISIEPLSVDDQARRAIRKAVGEAGMAQIIKPVVSWIQHVQSRFVELYPRSLEELELRSSPLREQWEARGPGLIAQLRRLLGADFLAENADAILVQPVMGGGGTTYPAYNRVSFEAVLANPIPDLPEVVRLGWLLAQLQLDLPIAQGNLSSQRTREVGAIALVPPSLAAAHEVELTGPMELMLPRALDAWRLPPVDSDTLLAWWESYLSARPAWSTALAALDRLLSEEAS